MEGEIVIGTKGSFWECRCGARGTGFPASCIGCGEPFHNSIRLEPTTNDVTISPVVGGAILEEITRLRAVEAAAINYLAKSVIQDEMYHEGISDAVRRAASDEYSNAKAALRAALEK